MHRLCSANLKLLTTNASGFAIGAILSQGEIGKDKPIAYASRSLNTHEVKYDRYNKESHAIVYFVTCFWHYLYGRKFNIFTGYKALIWFQNSKVPCSHVTRWKLKLSEYNFETVYKAGKMNINVDALSIKPADREGNVNERSVNRVISISNSRNNENLYTEIKYSGSTNLEDEGNFFQENSEEEDIDVICNGEINYEIIEGNNNT